VAVLVPERNPWGATWTELCREFRVVLLDWGGQQPVPAPSIAPIVNIN
jgi:hypothetical protein